MLILAIDSSTSTGSVALVSEQGLIGESILNLKNTHSQRLMPQLIQLMDDCGYQPSQLEGIAVALGPGSFTGTRIGLITAKTMAQALDIPIIGISTLKAMAFNLKYRSDYICTMIDGRRNRVFSALYTYDNQLVTVSKESLIDIDLLLDELSKLDQKIYFLGEVASGYEEKISSKISDATIVTGAFVLPKASSIAILALEKLKEEGPDDLFALTPNYLKRSQAEIQWEKKYQ